MVLSMERWRGKVAIVTGASAGIGAAIVQQLIEEGVRVVGFARRSERIEELSKKLKGKKGTLYAVKVDLRNEDDIIRGFQWTVDNVGPVHILINNAGLSQNTNLTDGDTEKWRTIFDTNVLALCIATREAVKIMKANDIDGHIVHINSMAGHLISPIPNSNVYPASKFAVTALTETLRQELNHHGSKIKISSVSPGATITEFITSGGLDPKLVALMNAGMNAEDVADAVLYVLSTPPHVQVHDVLMRAHAVRD